MSETAFRCSRSRRIPMSNMRLYLEKWQILQNTWRKSDESDVCSQIHKHFINKLYKVYSTFFPYVLNCQGCSLSKTAPRIGPAEEWLLAKVLERLSAFDALAVRVASKGWIWMKNTRFFFFDLPSGFLFDEFSMICRLYIEVIHVFYLYRNLDWMIWNTSLEFLIRCWKTWLPLQSHGCWVSLLDFFIFPQTEFQFKWWGKAVQKTIRYHKVQKNQTKWYTIRYTINCTRNFTGIHKLYT